MTRSKAEQRAVSRVPATCWCAFHLYIWRVRVRFGSVHNRAVHALSRAIEGGAIVSPCLIDGAAARRLHTDPMQFTATSLRPVRTRRCIVRFIAVHASWLGGTASQQERGRPDRKRSAPTNAPWGDHGGDPTLTRCEYPFHRPTPHTPPLSDSPAWRYSAINRTE